MKLGYVVFSGACFVVGLVARYGDFGIHDGDYVFVDSNVKSYSRPVGEDWEERQTANSSYVVTLNHGVELDEVLNSLGEPDFSQQFEKDVRILMYRTPRRGRSNPRKA